MSDQTTGGATTRAQPPSSPIRPRSWLARVGEWTLKILGLFVILEPIWMLLPFAGFLYGSLLQIQVINREPHLAWLAHFVFPILTGGWLGPVLVVLGLTVFCVAAGQIYWAKLRRTGLVTRGLYRFVRHPQYVALTLFGAGILLTWGRAITFIAFFVMMFLYYYLARSEERTCRRLFGSAYDQYAQRTSFILPGDRRLRGLARAGRWARVPAWARACLSLAATMALCAGLMILIQSVKQSIQTVPYLVAEMNFAGEESSQGTHAKGISPDDAKVSPQGKKPTEGLPWALAAREQTNDLTLPAGGVLTAAQSGVVPFVQAGRLVVARGPYRNAAAAGFAERLLIRLRQSATLKGFLAFLDEGGPDVAFVFCGPIDKLSPPGGPATQAGADTSPKGPGSQAGMGPGGRGPAPDPHGPYRVRAVLMRCELLGGANVAAALADKTRRRIKAGCVAEINLARPDDQDVVEADGKARGPGFPGENRWDFFMKQFSLQKTVGFQAPPPVIVPGRYESARLVLVRAPILRTRLDADFARQILDRLAGSGSFGQAARLAGAGGDVVAVAFPRPGPNWYREHHGQPQISLFVILAKRTGAGGVDMSDLFRPGGRQLVGAFTAEMDFARPPPRDSITLISAIGPRRDLEERWEFFLSGVGNEDADRIPPAGAVCCAA